MQTQKSKTVKATLLNLQETFSEPFLKIQHAANAGYWKIDAQCQQQTEKDAYNTRCNSINHLDKEKIE